MAAKKPTGKKPAPTVSPSPRTPTSASKPSGAQGEDPPGNSDVPGPNGRPNRPPNKALDRRQGGLLVLVRSAAGFLVVVFTLVGGAWGGHWVSEQYRFIGLAYAPGLETLAAEIAPLLAQNAPLGSGRQVRLAPLDPAPAITTQATLPQDSPPAAAVLGWREAWYLPATTHPIPQSLLDPLPTSTEALGNTAIPLAIDHVEVLFRRDLLPPALLTDDARLSSLPALVDALAPLAAPDFFPLLVSGADDQALVDFFSALALATQGRESYQALQALIGSEAQSSPEPFAEAWFDTLETTATPVFTMTRDLRRRGIIHPEWTNFSTADTETLMRSRLSAALVTRLSTHRTINPTLLRGWQSSPLPFADPTQAGSALLAPVLVLSLPAASPLVPAPDTWAAHLLGEAFQTSAINATGLAPVHPGIPTLDREGADLRYWAAASTILLAPLGSSLDPASFTAFAQGLRRRL